MNFKEIDYTEAEALIEWHNINSEYVVLDTETTGLNPFKDHITDIIISGQAKDEACLMGPECIPLFNNLRVPLVCHNFKFDFNMMYRAGVDLRQAGLYADTVLLDHLIDENHLEHGLDAIVQRRYGDKYKEVFWSKYENYTDAPKEEQLSYACSDVIWTGRIYRDSVADLRREKIPASLVEHVHRLALALYDTEISGLKLDLPYLSKMGEELKLKIAGLREAMYKAAPLEITTIVNERYLAELEKRKTDKGKAGVKRPEFNFDSNKQLTNLLYYKLQLPIQKNEKTRAITADDNALSKLEGSHPIISPLREYREAQKVYTAFIEGSLTKMHEGRIYPSFNVNGTVTGRLSSSNPNMQQLPKDGGVRGIYVPDDGYLFISCDYAQLEVTLAAHFSRDANLLRIVYEGASQHDITAQGLGIPRHVAKTINFALQYGAGAKKIQKILKCSEKEANEALTKYWETYSGLREFVKRCHSQVEQGIPLVNPFGRKRRFPTHFDDKWALERAKRQAANSLIQGTGADITNRAFYLVNQELNKLSIGRALFSVHDELLVMCKKDACNVASDLLQSIMKGVGVEIGLTVPLGVSCSEPMQRWEKS